MQTRVERKPPSTTKRMIWMVLGVLLLIAIIAGIKVMLVEPGQGKPEDRGQ